MTLHEQAAKHFSDILTHAMAMKPGEGVLLIYDRQNPFTSTLVDGFIAAQPDAVQMDFDTVTPQQVKEAIYARKAGDLVVLIQSKNFRLNEFRMRIELFNLGLKTIELTHLDRLDPSQYETFVAALAYDPDYIRPIGHALKAKLDNCQRVIVRCAGTGLIYEGGMEASKLNIGDYSAMKNVGGTFPIGEVFTEPKDLTRVNGSCKVFAFAGMDLKIREFKPFTMHIKGGQVSAGDDAPAEFLAILEMIRQQEQVIVREFGLGLNRAMGKGRIVNDLTAFERMSGLHLSLGSKHAIYKKPGLNPKKMRYHVDVFVDIESIDIDGTPIFSQGKYLV